MRAGAMPPLFFIGAAGALRCIHQCIIRNLVFRFTGLVIVPYSILIV